MMRRQAPHNKARGRDEQALLSTEAAPILSDDVSDVGRYSGTPNNIPPNHNSHHHHSSADSIINNNKKGWRSRLFGGSSRSTSSRSAGRAVSASRNHNDSDHQNLPMMAPAARSVSANRGPQQTPHAQHYQHPHQQQYQQQRLQQYPQQYPQQHHEDLRSTASGRSAPIDSANALSSRPEKRDDDSNPKGAATAATVTSKMTAATSATPQSVTSSAAASSVQLNDRSTRRAPPTVFSQSTRLVPSGVVGTILKKPFGREAVRLQDLKWLIHISPAEWEARESIWKYRVTIQKRMNSSEEEEIIQDLTNGLTLRSLTDFYWLEQALQTEFHGGMLIPSLCIALGVPDLENCQHEVDARLLTNWLSDIFNGVRGQGEWSLFSSLTSRSLPVNWQTCEAMEAFMYRTDLEPIGDVPTSPDGKSPNNNINAAAGDRLTWEDNEQRGILKFFINGEMCGLGSVCAPNRDEKVLAPPKARKINLPLNRQTVSSKALGDARALNVQDSFVEHVTPTFMLASIDKKMPALYTDLILSEQELVWNWRTRAMSVIEKLRIVQNEEKHIAAAWKRFAISISNLFAYEKEVESARLGESKTRKELLMPYRKLQKSAVEDMLRVMVKQKMERCTPSLDLLSVMLSAYVADLCSVSPAVEQYRDALLQLSMQLETVEILKEAKAEPVPTIADQIQAGLDQVKKQLVATSSEADGGAAKRLEAKLQQAEMQLESMEIHLRKNESMLKEHLTRLCRTVPVRTARMAYGYIQTESKQVRAIRAAAINTRTKLSVASKESLSKLIRRHGLEIKEDRVAEVQLVQRMVNLGSHKKFSKTDEGTEEVECGVEINKDVENRKAELRDAAMELCLRRIGRWDSKVAMAIVEAVGVEDANVRVEETTRDLRLVRKYAIGLRENVQRCVEALEELKLSIHQGGYGDIRDLRSDMMAELQMLFSGSYQPTEQPESPLNGRALTEHGIALNDPLGWCRKEDGCGGAAKAYMDNRESGTEWLLRSFGELLKDYYQRVETVESFVYMECVGIQLEKHFSQQRATALAAFEKKTDITSAINIATRKRMPVLVKELQAKLEAVGADVSHTTVKETKEAHLESKAVKQELHDLSMRQLSRAQETATERVIALMTLWSKEEENSASSELDLLKAYDSTLEESITTDVINPYLEAAPLV